MIQQPTTVVFNLMCAEPRAWVVVSGQDRRTRVLEMWQPRPGHWSACTVLTPGDYRGRCYAGDGRNAVYCGPAEVDGGSDCGMDAAFTVRTPPVWGRDPAAELDPRLPLDWRSVR